MTTVYQVIQDTVLSGTSSIGVGASAAVTIRDAETAALVTLFQDRLGAGGETNPFNADANGQFRVYTAPGRLQITVVHNAVTRIWEDYQLENPEEQNKGAIGNFGFTATLDSPAAGDITVAFKQGDNSANCTEIAPAVFNFWGTKEPLKLEAAKTLKLDSSDDFGLDDRVANTALFLFIYAIDRGGALEFGIGPRSDFTRATADFTAVEGEAVDRDHVFCTAAITANDPCHVIGYFKATYDTTAQDWSAITAESDVVGGVPGPHPRSEARAWINLDGTGTIAERDSLNVAAISDIGTGQYEVFWDTDFADGNYAAVATCVGVHARYSSTGTYLTTKLRIICEAHDGVVTDSTLLVVVAFGDQ